MLRVPRRRAAARHRPADHRHDRRRRRARVRGQPGGAGPSRQPRPVRPGGGRLPGRRRRRHAAALLAYLTAEDDQGNGLDVATPTAADSVKLLTVHRAKGLEWDGRCSWSGSARRGSRPTGPARCGRRRRRCCPAPLRGDAKDLPQLRGYDRAALDGLPRGHPGPRPHRGAAARLRRLHPRRPPAVGLVLLLEPRGRPRSARRRTRASSASCWREWGEPEPAWLDKPAEGRPQPLRRRGPVATLAAHRHRRPRRSAGSTAAALVRARGPRRRGRRSSTWSRAPGSRTGTPSSSGCSWRPGRERIADDRGAAARQPVGDRAAAAPRGPRRVRPRAGPADAAAAVARRAVRHPCSTPGSRRASASSRCSTPTTCPAAATPASTTTLTSTRVIEPFEEGPFADRVPHAVEAPFALVLAGQVVRGRIDAVYEEPDGGFLVVDWKTNRSGTADPLQLAIYRLAWAELRGVPLEQVRAAFHYVRTGETVEPADLPDRQALEGLLTVAPDAATGLRQTFRRRVQGRVHDSYDVPGWADSGADLGGFAVQPLGDAAGGHAAGPVGADGAGRGAVADQLDAGVGDGGGAVELDAAVPRLAGAAAPRWATAGRKPVAHRITSAGSNVPSAHAHAVGLDARRTSGAARRRRAARPRAPARAAPARSR